MIKIILPGSIRSKKNSKRMIAIPSRHKSTIFKRYKHGGSKPVQIVPMSSNAYLKWETIARESALMQISALGKFRSALPLKSQIHVKALIYYKGRRPDLSGAMESIGDCLEGVIWENDSQLESWDGSRLIHDLENPRTEIEIKVFKGD